MPDLPSESGNPVFSVWQTDVIVNGRDLADYLQHEFLHASSSRGYRLADLKAIPFWTDLVAPNC